jgi:TPP-dependent 2-oxoacid decarboxylase
MNANPEPTSAPEQQNPPTIAEHLLDRLAALGVRHVFGVPGDYNLALLEVIEAHPTLQWIGTANELNAAYAADGYARLRGMAALVTTYGVGELSAMNGIAGSFAENVPVLHIVGAPSSEISRRALPVHHSLLDGDPGHFQRAYREVTCADAEVTADNGTAEIDRVLAEILDKKRPGYLNLPSDLVNAPVSSRPGSFAPPRTAPASRLFRARVEELLDGADRVAVLVDFLAQRYDVGEGLEQLIRTSGSVWATTTAAKGALDETTPGFQGVYLGALSDPGARSAIEDADVIIGAGLRLADLSTGGFTARLDPVKLIDLQPAHAVIAGEVIEGVALSSAVDELATILPTHSRAVHTKDDPAHTPTNSAATASEKDTTEAPLTQEAFWRRFEAFIKPGDILAPEQGTAFYGLLGLRLPAGVDVITQALWASIGYTLPAIFGAQLATGSQRRAVLVIGDGSLQMTVQELGTIIRHGLDPIIIVLNNNGYTVERAINGWTAGYNDIGGWNLTELPKAFGAVNALVRQVTTLPELDDVLTECGQVSGRMRFIEVVLDRHDMPPLLLKLAQAVAEQND